MLFYVKVLFIGDIFATPGLKVLKQFLAEHKSKYDFIIANAENASGGFGLTKKHFKQIVSAGVDVVTLGNHSWDQRETLELVEETNRLVRPLNYPIGTPGLGFVTHQARNGQLITVVQVQGRIFLEALDCPFSAMDNLLENLPKNQTIILDFHAEATSEKKVMAYHLKSRVSAVLGTHTHVQTADETIMSGTAYITDVGMTGVQESSIGMRFEEVHQRFVKKIPARYKPADSSATLCAVELEIEDGKAMSIERIQWEND